MPPDFSREVYCILGLPFDAVDLPEAERRVRHAVATRTRCFLSTPNLNFAMACRTDAAFRNSVINSDLVIADGMPLVWIARLLGLPIRKRVAGSSLFEALRHGSGKPVKVYFFGGPDGIAATACARLNAEPGGMRCVGYHSPGFGSVEQMSSDAIIADINASGADFLVVALGARKGQAWIEYNLPHLEVPVISHLGAVINFVAGNIRRAPLLVQKLGLEWSWRIKEEPSLWKRYFQDGVALLGMLVTRVAPLIWKQKIFRSSPKAITTAQVEVTEAADTVSIRMSGHWNQSNLQTLRNALSIADAHGGNALIDLRLLSGIDSASVGLLQLYYGSLRQRGVRAEILTPTAKINRLFSLHCSEFVLESVSGTAISGARRRPSS